MIEHGGRERDRAWRHSERGRLSAALATRRWSLAHAAELREYRTSDRVRALRREYVRRWSAAHPIERRQVQHERRLKLKLAGPRLSTQEWQLMVEQFDHRCFYCGRREAELTMDHLIPLRLGGTNANYNIVPACRSCNSRKRTMTAVDFLNIVERVA